MNRERTESKDWTGNQRTVYTTLGASKWEDVPKLNLYIRPGRDKPNFAFLHKNAWEQIPQLHFHKPETDAEFRAMTPPGFAEAFFRANK